MNNVFQGAYTVTVKDANNCLQPAIAIINNIAGPIVVVTNTASVVCFGQTNGGATVTVAGGAGGNTFLWSYLAQTSQNVNNLPAGIHTLTVTDQANCVSTATVNITQPSSALLTTIGSVTNVACMGQFNGAAQMVTSGGVQAYSYLWQPSAQTNSVLTGVSSGNYSCTVTDANGCVSTKTVSIIQPNPLIITTNTVSNVTCNGFSNGQINTTINGGTPTYSITWTPTLPATQTVTGLTAGSYSLQIIDTKGCATNSVYTIVQPTSFFYLMTTYGACANTNGSITLSVSGSVPPYTYSWTPTAQTTSVITGLSSGNYTATTTDANGCILISSVLLPSIQEPTVTAISNSSLICNGQTATLTASGANTYSWNTSATGPIIAVSPSVTSTYTVIGTSGNGCTSTATVTQIVSLQAPTLTAISNTSLICNGQTATLTASGANTYTWNTSATGSVIAVSPSVTTTYTVTGTNGSGCSNSATMTQSVSLCTALNALSESENSNFKIYPNPFLDEIVVSISDLKNDVKLSIFNSLGQLVYQTQVTKTNSVINLKELLSGLYFVRTEVLGQEKVLKLIKE
jgi:hypothetical protein